MRVFGNTGISLPPIGLGGMPLSIAGRPVEAQSERVVMAALDAGMRYVDTADVYCLDQDDLGHNERLIAEALRQWGREEQIFVATKGGCTRPDGRWGTDGRPEHLRRACEASLKALKTERIWLYQLHAVDDSVPFEDSVAELARLRVDGKIEHIGLSNVTAIQIRQACAIAPIASVQNRLGPLDTRPFRDGVITTCEELGIAFLAYSPVGGGRGKTRVASDPVLTEIGAQVGASPFQVALAWLVQRSPVIFPIPGASKVSSARSSAAALQLVLPPDAIARMDAAFVANAR